eukprot:3353982-Amphidinium_carterae.1
MSHPLSSALRPLSTAFKSMQSTASKTLSGKPDATNSSSSTDAASPLTLPSPRREVSPAPPRSPPQKEVQLVQVAGTEIPEDLYLGLLKEGAKARRRGQHCLLVVQDSLGRSSVPDSQHLLLSHE